ncbi:DUF2326 domain-containing protein [Acinetobacter baumannii]|nr:DUF2326 domain-containing protein [Acinetobacter baumannii]
MKLSKLYSNLPKLFEPINFHDGLNVVVAEIRLAGNTDKDTHNLGKSTLRDLINFCLVSKKEKDFFLFAHKQFEPFIFFLEIELQTGIYLTIRRSVLNGSKFSFKQHKEKHQNFSKISDEQWDHFEVGYDKSKHLLDSYLNLNTISPYSFRKIIGYLLRSQNEYTDPFDLGFKGAHSQWKPLLAKILGFDSQAIEQSYNIESELEVLKDNKKKTLPTVEAKNLSEIEGLIAIKNQTLEIKEKELESLDFSSVDQITTDNLVKQYGSSIRKINNDLYYLKAHLEQINISLSESKVKFNVKETEQLFNDIGIVFNDQIVKNYNQLVEFHNDIMKERRTILIKEKNSIEKKINDLNDSLKTLNLKRSESLNFLNSNDILVKYKNLANEVATIKSNISYLQEQSKIFQEAKEIQNQIRIKEKEYEKIVTNIENSIELNTAANSESVFAQIRLYFSYLINAVISEPAMISVNLNNENHLNFSANLLDATGNKTSADKGNSYKKLMCVAFDLSLLKAYQTKNFPHFVFHDGVFETLDDRKKENLLYEMRLLAKSGIQQIITMIQSDIPNEYESIHEWISESEITVVLHDDGESGRLFKMPSW